MRRRPSRSSALEKGKGESQERQCGTMMGWSSSTQQRGIGWRCTTPRKFFSVLVNGWEMWEPNKKTRKDLIRTKWRREEKDKKKKSIEEKRPRWENEEQGYASDLELNAEYDLGKITCEKVGHELGEYEEEELEDHDKKGEEGEEEEAG
jgi:hypothetical protein